MTGMQIFYIVTSALLWGCIFLNLSMIADNWRQNRLLRKLITEAESRAMNLREMEAKWAQRLKEEGR